METSNYLSDRPKFSTLRNCTNEVRSAGKQRGISATFEFKKSTKACRSIAITGSCQSPWVVLIQGGLEDRAQWFSELILLHGAALNERREMTAGQLLTTHGTGLACAYFRDRREHTGSTGNFYWRWTSLLLVEKNGDAWRLDEMVRHWISWKLSLNEGNSANCYQLKWPEMVQFKQCFNLRAIRVLQTGLWESAT